MARRSKKLKPSVERFEDCSDDLGFVDPKFLYEVIKHVGVYVYDVETCGAGKDALNPRKGRLDGIAFYVPAGCPKDLGELGFYDGRPIRAWFPFNPFSFMCHIRVKDIPNLEPKVAPIGVDIDLIRETAKTPEGLPRDPDELILVDLRPPMDQEKTMEALRPIWQELRDVVAITANGKFDSGFLWVCPGTVHPIRINNIWADSMLADFVTDERRKRYGLKIRVKQEFNHQMTPYADAVKGQSMLAFCNAKPLAIYACLHDSARIVVEGGKTLSIGEIVNKKLDVQVATWNSDSNEMEFRKITGWHRSRGPKTQRWLRIRTRYGLPNRTSANKKTTVVTPDHEIWTTRGWVEAQDLKVGDTVLAPECSLSPAQEQLILGSLLGDGFLQNPHNLRASFAVTHATKASDYIYLKQTILGQHIRSTIRFQNEATEIAGRLVAGGPASRIVSRVHSEIAGLVDLCYPDGVKPSGKQVSQAWLDRIDERGLCFFYLDDGTLCSKNRVRSLSARFITHDHGEEGTNLIRDWLKTRFGLDGVIDFDKRKTNGWSIRLNDASSRKLFDLIAPYVPEGMSYKLGRAWENRFNLSQFGQIDVFTPIHDEVLVVEPYTPKRQESTRARYCLTIEGNNNFFTQNCLVHNCDDCYWEYRLHERSIEKMIEEEPPPKGRTEPKWTIEKKFGRVMGRLERVYWGIDTRISEIIMEMQNAGVLIDWQWLKKVNKDIEKQKSDILRRIESFLGWPLNPNATKQVADALFAPAPDGLGLPQKGIPIGKTGDPSTSDKVIKHFARFHPLVADIIKWRSLDTVQGGFVKKLIKLALESPDGRVYAHFHQTRTVIARLASSDPINFQNQPRDKDLVRKAYCSHRVGIETDDQDLMFLGGDYCVVAGTRVITTRGAIPIEEVKPGDQIITDRDQVANVAALVDKGEQLVSELITKRGHKIRATGLHRIRCIDSDGNYVWRRIHNLKIDDVVCLKTGGLDHISEFQSLPPLKFTHPNNRRDVTVPSQLTPEFARLLGYIVGDGSLEEKCISAVVALKDPDVLEWYVGAVEKFFGHAPRVDRQDEKGVWRTRIHSVPLVQWFNHLGINKESVAEVVWRSPPKVIAAFLSGCFEADGSIGKESNGRRVSWSSSRETLARDVSRLLMLSGIFTVVRKEKASLSTEEKTFWGYHITLPSAFAGEFLERIDYIGCRKKQQIRDYSQQAGYSSAIGGLPLQQAKSKNLNVIGEARRLLNNTRTLGRPISRRLMEQLRVFPDVFNALDLDLFVDHGIVPDSIISIKPAGLAHVYDLSVPGPMTYISDGFISHNSQVELRVAAHLSQEENMIEVYKMGGICTAEAGDACDVYKVWVCEEGACGHKWTPTLWTAPNKTHKCPKCESQHTEHQARCRHVDLHTRTAEDAQVKRNPLAKNCVTGDSLILTEHGLLRMDEVVTEGGRAKKTIGIMSDDGKIRQTESTWGGGVQKVADVHMEYGLKVTATYDHKFFVMREGKVEQIPVEDLKPGDPVLTMMGRDVHGTEIALPRVEVEATTSFKDVDLPRFLTAEVARFLGYVVAEGRYETSPGRYQFWIGLANYDLDMHEDLKQCIESVIPERLCLIPYEEKTVFSLASKSLNTWLEALGIGKSSGTKAIPACIRQAPWAIKREFFRALFEGDGTSKSSGKDDKCRVISYTSKSETLIRQIQAEMMNVNILGFVSSETRLTQEGRKRYWVWTLRRQSDLARFAEMVGFISERKQKRMESLLIEGVTDRSNRFLDGVEPLLEQVWDKVKRKQKDKLREIIRRKNNPVRFGDTRVQLLSNVLPEEITKFVDAGIWTAKVQRVEDAGEAEVYDVYEPERTAMVVNSCVILDCNFGLLYRMGAPKFCIYADLFDSEGMPMVQFAKEIIARWHAAYPGIAPFHEITDYNLERRGWVAKTLFGRRRRLDQETRANRFRAVTQGIQFMVSGCVAPETPILTESGYVPINQLAETKLSIFDGAGFTSDYSVFETGEKEVFEVKLSDGRTLECSGEHRLAGMDGLEMSWPQVKNLGVGDLVATRPILAPGGKAPGGDSADDAYLIGLLVGDGYYGDSRGFTVACSTKDTDWSDTICESIRRSLGNEVASHICVSDHENKYGHTRSVAVNNADARSSLMILGLDCVSKKEKRIPGWLKTSPAGMRAAVIAGLFDSDGTIKLYPGKDGTNTAAIIYTTVVKELADSAQLLLSSLGIGTTLRQDQNKELGSVVYRLSVPYRYMGLFKTLIPIRHHQKLLQLEKIIDHIKKEPRRSLPKSFVKAVAELAYQQMHSLRGGDDSAHRVIQRYVQDAKRGRAGVATIRSILDYIDRLQSFEEVLEFDWLSIVSIREIGVRPTFDIEIHGKNHAYVANSIWQHNSAQDIMKTGMIRVWDAREARIANARPAERKLWKKFKFLLQIHDECVWEIPKQIANEASVLVKDCMEGVGKGSLRIPLTFDTKIGRNWDDVH